MTDQLLNRTVGASGHRVANSPIESLSDRELETFRLIGLGLATHQIGDTMKLSPKTLETYRDRIRSKLNLNSGTEMSGQSLIWIMENG